MPRERQWVDVGGLEDFEDRRPRVVEIQGREIGVLRWRGEVFAMRNVCPHQHAPVCRGTALALITADETGKMEVDPTRPVVACPWHGWEFDARSGRAIWSGSRYKLKTYPAQVRDGRVLIAVAGAAS